MAVAVEQVETPSVNRRRLRIFLMYILPPLIALFVVLLPLLSTVSILPRIGISPGFAMIDQQGDTVTNEDLRGEIILFGLVSLNCDEGCVATIDAMRQAATEANVVADDPDQPSLRLVAIVVDSVVEPDILADFASSFEMDTWSVLSGSESTVRAVIGSGFEVYLAKSANGETQHDPGVFLTDHAGFLRAEYRTENPRPGTIAADIERIVNEANAGAVGGLFYNAAHSLSLSCGG